MKRILFVGMSFLLIFIGMLLGAQFNNLFAQSVTNKTSKPIEVVVPKAPVTKSSFSQVEVFSGASGYVKFFDKSTGKIYIYDNELTKCTAIVQVEELGKPGVPVKE